MKQHLLDKVLWLGDPPPPPPRRWFHLGRNWHLGKYRPHGIPVRELAERSSASSEFRQECSVILKTVPDNLRAILSEFGLMVQPTWDIFETLEFSDYHGPRGHGDRFTWPRVSGLCRNQGHVVVLCEYVVLNERRQKAENRQGVFNHELGHSFDAACDYISQKEEFLARVKQDTERIHQALPPSLSSVLHYFLAEAPQGPSEIFAECFAACLGVCAVKYWTEDMKSWFPKSYEMVERLVALPPHELRKLMRSATALPPQ